MPSFIHVTSDPEGIREVRVKVFELRRKRWEEGEARRRARYGLTN